MDSAVRLPGFESQLHLFASWVTVVISKFTLLDPSFLPGKVEKITVAIFRYCCKDEIIKHMQSTLENYVWIG